MKCIRRVYRKFVLRTARCRDERGQSLVEAALGFPLLMLLFFGIIEFSLVVFTYNTLSNAAREGARYGVMRPNDAAGMATAARRLTTAIQCGGAGMTISSSQPAADTVRVDVDCNAPLLTQMIITALGGTGTIPLHASATMQVE
jgi:Flp pilus assembly protein TadG